MVQPLHATAPTAARSPELGRAQRAVVAVTDESTRELAAGALARVGLLVDALDSGCAARASMRTRPTRLLVLDLGITDLDAVDLLAELRESTVPPVIAVGRFDSDVECMVALEHGADDYVGRPLSPSVFAARAGALLRRTDSESESGRTSLSFDTLDIDRNAREARIDGERVDLTAKEFALLEHLACHPRTAFSRAELLRAVWGSDPAYQSPATVTEHVRRLRSKLATGTSGGHIGTVQGVGYRFDP